MISYLAYVFKNILYVLSFCSDFNFSQKTPVYLELIVICERAPISPQSIIMSSESADICRVLSFNNAFPGKESACQCRRCRRCGLDPWVGKIPWKREWQPALELLPGKSHRQRSLAGCNPWGHRGLDTT